MTGGGASTRPRASKDSPVEALDEDEVRRTRWFCLIGAVIAACGTVAVLFLPGDPRIGRVLTGAVAVGAIALAVLYTRTGSTRSYYRPSTNIAWFIAASCATVAIPYFGPFSPGVMVLVLVIYFFGLGRSSSLALAIYGECMVVQAVFGGLVCAGARDYGVVSGDRLGPREQIILQALIQTIYLATYVTARMSRRTTTRALQELEAAVRTAAHREALLLEAREQLARVPRPGHGRFTNQILGGYELGAVLGNGSMGEVYAARGPEGEVAVKVLGKASFGNEQHLARFLRELRISARVISPHVVRVIEVGEDPVPYLVMDRLSGQSLSAILSSQRTLPAGETIELAHQVGLGITAARDAGVVHRDLKPQNIFRDQDLWKVIDFGVARGADQLDTLTKGNIVGTPSYMAPEQASGEPVDHATDLYALAAVIYRAITGCPPYAGSEVPEVLYKVVHTRPRRPSELVQVPREIDVVLAIGMARDAKLRFRSADELVEGLREAFAGRLSAIVARRAPHLDLASAWERRARERVSTAAFPTTVFRRDN